MDKELLEYFNGDELAANVWLSKYAQEGEKTPDDMHKRMSKEIAKIEKRYGKTITSMGAGSIINGVGGYIVNKKFNISGINDGNSIEDLYNEFANRKNIYKRLI